MEKPFLTQRTFSKFAEQTYIPTWIDAFLIDRKVGNKAAGTVMFYRQKLQLFTRFCDAQAISDITQITPAVIRSFLLWLEDSGHNPGGRHGAFRALKAFLHWWENEIELEGWKNPVKRVSAPKINQEPLQPVSVDDVRKLIDVCPAGTFHGDRDRALFLTLLDSGIRAAELLNLALDDVNLVTGEIIIRKGKGNKTRVVFIGQKTRKAIRAYTKHITAIGSHWLWLNKGSEQLQYGGLREILKRRSESAGVETPSAHDFRRAFALNMLRAGVDIYSLKNLMGHSELTQKK